MSMTSPLICRETVSVILVAVMMVLLAVLLYNILNFLTLNYSSREAECSVGTRPAVVEVELTNWGESLTSQRADPSYRLLSSGRNL